MNISLKWLNDYIDLSGVKPEEIENALPMLGLEIESVKTLGLKQLDNVVVGEILSRDPHPNADKLGVCKVLVDPNKDPIQIVCGAHNYVVGDRVPVALIGAKLPCEDGSVFEIKASKLRGIDSFGMMCSARELGLGQDHSGLLILTMRPEVGTPINDVFKDSDTMYEIELTANRGDCLSHIGVARELAAKFNLKVKTPQLKAVEYSDKPQSELLKSIELKTENCPLYTAAVVRNVKIAPSPDWLKRDLEAVGLRPINNVVDITNFVMMEYGQPLHAFDANDITTKSIVVRTAKDGEKIKTLDGKEHTLCENNTLICNGETPVALAGVMGGENSEVKDTTCDVILESAYFNPGNVRATSRKLAISTDAAYRYARDVDPKGVFDASARTVELLEQIAGGKKEGATYVAGKAPRGDRTIEISLAYICDKLGFKVCGHDVVKVFESLGFSVEQNGENFKVLVPSFRSEVDRPIDLVEEFIRIFGSDKIPETRVMVAATHRDDDKTFVFERKVSDFLADWGFNECQHYTLRDSKLTAKLHGDLNIDALKLDNPLTSDQDCIRPSLIDGLLDAVRLNLDAQNSFKGLFEVGKVFRTEKDGLIELMSVAFVFPAIDERRMWEKRQNPDFFTAKKLVCDIFSILGIDRFSFDVNESEFFQKGFAARGGFIGREGYAFECGALNLAMLRENGINIPVYAGEVILKSDVCSRKKHIEKFKSFSLFPLSTRDVAVIVDQSAKASDLSFEILKIAQAKAKGLCDVESVDIFDEYQGKGLPENKKSLAFSIAMRSAEKTLKAEEVAKVFDAVCAELAKKYQLRA